MRGALRFAYGAAGHLARAAAVLAPPGDAKWRRALRARRGIRDRFRAWGPRRDPERPLLWMHAPSVGEGLQARPVLELVRARRPHWQVAYTFFSASAERFAASLGADFTDYLPFDTLGDARIALEALRPSALVFSKLDVWPLLVSAAAHRGVRLGMVSATLSPTSGRTGRFVAGALRESYARLERVGAISANDAARLMRLGVPAGRVSVTGDTRFDQVWSRASGTDVRSPLLAPFAEPRPTLVAGSTWPSDEAVLLDAWLEVRHHVPNARLIVAPHEPTPRHVERLEHWARAHSLSCARLGADAARAGEIVIVDRVGVLGELYAVATVAWVGGGFHGAGLHSVLEPAAFGAPVVFGPRHANSREAGELLGRAAARQVADGAAAAGAVLDWLTNSVARDGAGRAARYYVRAGLGAAERSFALVVALVESGRAEVSGAV